MHIHCPHCNFDIAIKGAKVQDYQPTCPQCKHKFVMRVTNNNGKPSVLVGKTLELLKPVKGLKSNIEQTQTAAPPKSKPPQQKDISQTVSSTNENINKTMDATAPPKQAQKENVNQTMDAASQSKQAQNENIDQTVDSGATVASSAKSTRPSKPVSSTTKPNTSKALSGTLDGYEIDKVLGEGGMGAVYLARQISLDREVALKTIKPQLAADSTFLSRFTREAYAAAQLTHHNVVQIYDLGEGGEGQKTPFFSMEYVSGHPLSDYLKEKGALDVEEAAGYILQAARGLKFAHDHGMVHRDIKPANLLLNSEGVVKVADLGLVKLGQEQAKDDSKSRATNSSQSDDAHTSPSAMGTPAYMAPEQAEDAAHVDGRADIYSLGCTFYSLVTGRHIFEGTTAKELMTKHAQAKVIPPETIAARVPKSVSAIIMRMVAKKPEERYANTQELIEALESFLGISAGPFTPRPEHAEALEQAAQTFNHAGLAKVRKWAMRGFLALLIVIFIIALFTANLKLAAGTVCVWLLTGAGYAIICGVTQRTYLFKKLRQLVFTSRLREWIGRGIIAIIIIALIILFNLQWVVIISTIIGAVLGALLHFGLDTFVNKQRKGAVITTGQMLKTMRLRGLEEDALRRFVCKYCGKHWEEFYEALFGYQDKMRARRLWGTDGQGKGRPKYGAWRDRLISWIEQKGQKREEDKQRKHLQKVEARRLVKEGKSEAQAATDAKIMTQELATKTQQNKEAAEQKIAPSKANHRDKKSGSKIRSKRATPLWWRWSNRIIGAKTRFVIGLILLAAYILWVKQNHITQIFKQRSGLDGLRHYINYPHHVHTNPLSFSIFSAPDYVMQILSSHGVGLAGLLLVVSAFVGRLRMTITMIPAAIVLIGGPLVLTSIPNIPVFSAREIVLLVGLVLGIAGIWLGRDGDVM